MAEVQAIEQEKEQAIREAAYFIWEREGRPDGRAQQHWQQAIMEILGAGPEREAESFEEKVLAGRSDPNRS